MAKRNKRAAKRKARDRDYSEALLKLSNAIAMAETVSLAMQTHEDQPDFGSIAVASEMSVRQLRFAYHEIDMAFMRLRR